MFFEGKEEAAYYTHVCMYARAQCTLLKFWVILFILQIKCDGEKGNNGNQKIGFPCRSANDVEFYLNTPFFILFERI